MGGPANIRERLMQIASKRILILDGAMGSMIQAYRTPSGEPLSEDDFRGLTGEKVQGDRFRDHPRPLRGCNDLLCLTMPQLISPVHEAYLRAGADIIETCSFNSTAVSLADYGLGDLAYEISAASARLAREAADAFSTPGKPRFVAGSMGPCSKSLGISPDINDPGKRTITWDELEAAYYDNARGLIDGGAELLLIETVFDTLNAKAAIFAVKRLAEERAIDVPLVISATISEGGRLLSGQSVEAFCVSVSHADPLAIGLNCSFGAEKLKPHIATLSAAVPCLVSLYPNAGLPNRFGVYEEDPEAMADHLEPCLQDELVNIVGGCCGSTPDHIAAISERAKKYSPRPLPEFLKRANLAGSETLNVSRDLLLTHIGNSTNVAGNAEFFDFLKEDDFDGAVDLARNIAEDGAALLYVRMDDALPADMTNFLNYALQFPDLARLPVMIGGSRWEVIEAGLKCLQGKGLVNSISLKDGEAEFLRRARLARSYGAALVVTFSGGEGRALSDERMIAEARRSLELLVNSGFLPEDIIFGPDELPAGVLEYYNSILLNRNLLPLEEARKKKVSLSWSVSGESQKELNLTGIFDLPADAAAPEAGNTITLRDYPMKRVIPHIDWRSFVQTWDLAANTYPLAYNKADQEKEKKKLKTLLDDARKFLEKIDRDRLLSLNGVLGFFPAYSEGDDIVLPDENVRFCFPRNQERKPGGGPNPCLADFILPRELYKKGQVDPSGRIGFFALSAGFGLREAERDFRSKMDDYYALLLTGLANSLVYAFSEEVHSRINAACLPFPGGEPESGACGIRPAFGYPGCPDHKDKEIVFRLLDVRQRCGLQLTETAMLIPAASVCGMYITHPDSFYFAAGIMGEDQLDDWAARKGLSREEANKRLGLF